MAVTRDERKRNGVDEGDADERDKVVYCRNTRRLGMLCSGGATRFHAEVTYSKRQLMPLMPLVPDGCPHAIVCAGVEGTGICEKTPRCRFAAAHLGNSSSAAKGEP